MLSFLDEFRISAAFEGWEVLFNIVGLLLIYSLLSTKNEESVSESAHVLDTQLTSQCVPEIFHVLWSQMKNDYEKNSNV